MTRQPIGVLIMAYGTPQNLNQVEAYYTHIRHGSTPSRELLDELIGRYEAIGGVSPLNAITQAQAEGVENLLNQGGKNYRVYLGMKHVSPFIEEAVAKMAEDGIAEAVSLVLAPHFSTMSVGAYQKSALDAVAAHGNPQLFPVRSWHLHPRFLELLANRVQEGLSTFSDPSQVMVVFTAHSLPERILAQHDPYPEQVKETGEAVAAKLGLPHYMFGWQSAGRTEEKWLGPDILTILRDLHHAGRKQVLVCPVGFVSDHLEVLYDLDIEARKLAHELSITFERTQSLNTDVRFLETLAEVVRHRQHAGSPGELLNPYET